MHKYKYSCGWIPNFGGSGGFLSFVPFRSFWKWSAGRRHIISGLFTQIEHISHNFLLPNAGALCTACQSYSTYLYMYLRHVFLVGNFMKMLPKLNENILTMPWRRRQRRQTARKTTLLMVDGEDSDWQWEWVWGMRNWDGVLGKAFDVGTANTCPCIFAYKCIRMCVLLESM